MPTYEYSCEKCDHQFDMSQSMKDAPLTVCPKEHCGMKKWGKGKVKKLIGGGAGLIFKGSGFYITDYRSDSYKEAAKKDIASSHPTSSSSSSDKKNDSGASKSESKSETKPAKTETKPAKSSKSDK